MEEWENYFLYLFQGNKEKRRETLMERKTEQDQEDELKEKEIEKQLRKLKKKKAAGIDRLSNKVWLFNDGRIREKLKEILKKVWKGEVK